MKKIVLTGGGSGGHVIPNIALINALQDKAEIYYIGSKGTEKQLIPPIKQVQFFEYSPPKLHRAFTMSNFAIPFRFIKAIASAKTILTQIKPNVVFSKGGYVGLPVIFAASKLGIPCVGHESDITLGLAHKLALPRYKKLFTAFETTSNNKKLTYSGALLRNEITKGSRSKGLVTCGFDGQKKILLVTGGSLGAFALNEKISTFASTLGKTYDIFLLTGKGKNIYKNTSYFHTAEFVSNIADLYACADYVITRGGANALCEITACALPFVAVPLSHSSRNEQSANAQYFVKRKMGELLPENQLTLSNLTAALTRLVQHKQERTSAQPISALDTISEYLLSF